MDAKWKTVLKDIKEFSQETTIHGVIFLFSYRLHVLERLFWAVIVITAVVSSIALCLSNWNRYLANPTVVSLQKDFRNWNNPFPAATGCFSYKTDDAFVDEYIADKWGVNDSHPLYDHYVEFVKTVANISYQSLDAFRKFQNDSTLNNVDMMDLAVKVHPDSTGTLVTFDTKEKPRWMQVITEMGICFTINSLFASILSFRPEDKKIDSTKIPILRCHYLNGLCYARFDSEPDAPVQFYIHSYLDITHATISPPWNIIENQEVELNYRMQETISDVSLKSLSPAQRRCRFEHEPVSREILYYSSSICSMLCRYKAVIRICGCKPFFYHNLGGKVCDLKGLICVADHVEYLTQPSSKLGCDCPQPCNIVIYIPQTPKITVWEYGYFDQRITFRWGLLPPTTKYHRDVLFGFEDLVVSFGGIVALFLGISFISIIETIFFIVKIGIRSCQLVIKEATSNRT